MERYKMEIDEVMERIRLPREARQEMIAYAIPQKEYRQWKQYFEENLKTFIEKWKVRTDPYRWALCFYLRLACETYDMYQEKHIEDQVFDQTFYDITIWCEECYKKHNVYGLEEVWWIAQSVQMKLFRLGRLQFEPVILEADIYDGDTILESRGKEALNVHIPAGEPLDYDACVDSFKRAEEFFSEKEQVYVCDSWLLSSNLKDLLPEDSNIIRFQKLFHIWKVHYRFPQAEQRIFGEIKEEKSQYPEKTRLQKKAKRYLQTGKRIGIGVGVIENVYKSI